MIYSIEAYRYRTHLLIWSHSQVADCPEAASEMDRKREGRQQGGVSESCLLVVEQKRQCCCCYVGKSAMGSRLHWGNVEGGVFDLLS